MNPPNGRLSGEMEIISEPARRRQKFADEAKKAIALRERRQQLFEALVDAHKRTGHRITIRPDDGSQAVTLDQIARAVCRKFETPRAVLFSIRRKTILVHPRQVMMYLAMQLTDMSFPQVGRFMGKRDHTTILHGHRKISRLLAEGNEKLAAEIADIKKLLGVE
jgi:chromosomal replication initiator protein